VVILAGGNTETNASKQREKEEYTSLG